MKITEQETKYQNKHLQANNTKHYRALCKKGKKKKHTKSYDNH